MNQEIYRKTSNKQNLLPMWRTVLAFALVATDNCWNIEKYGRKQLFYEFLLRGKHVASKNWQKRNNWKNHTFLPEIHPRRHLLNKSLKKNFFFEQGWISAVSEIKKDLLAQLLKPQPFKGQFQKMLKHTQTIRRQIFDELFECVWPFCGIST